MTDKKKPARVIVAPSTGGLSHLLGATIPAAFLGHEDPNFSRWFAGGALVPAGGRLGWTLGNDVRFYSEMWTLFVDVWTDFQQATKPSHFLYILGFESSPDIEIISGVTLRAELERAVRAGVEVRGIFNGEATSRLWNKLHPSKPIPIKNNAPMVDAMNAMKPWDAPGLPPPRPETRAVLDSYVAPVGAHHQKVIVVQGEQGLVAYCGGVDLARGRNSPAWHDVHCRIAGPAAFDLLELARARWRHNGGAPERAAAPPRPAPLAIESACAVQIVQTFPPAFDLPAIFKQPAAALSLLAASLGVHLPMGGEPSRPPRDTSLFELLKHAIGVAKKFIYVEDQFMVCNNPEFHRALRAKVVDPGFSFLVMITLDDPSADGSLQKQAHLRRSELVLSLTNGLGEAERKKLVVCTRDDGYLHAKAWVFDDEFAIIGSANMNNRGYSSDSEVAAGIADPNRGGKRLSFAHALRVTRWMKHLAVGPQAVLDPMASYELFRVASTAIPKRTPFLPSLSQRSALDDLLWREVIDPT